jgi:hypothetical protein
MQRRATYAFFLSLIFLSIQLLGCGGGNNAAIMIGGSVPATGTVGASYLGTLMATGGSGSYMWTVGGLPPGVMASGATTATLSVSGTPTTAGTFAFMATVTDSKGHTATSSVSIVISAATPTITITGTLPATGTVGAPYTGSLTASGGTAPYMWSVTGLPAGVTPSGVGTPTVTASGTPTTAGTSAVSATVTDANANTATFTTSVVISAAAANLSVRLPAGYPLSATVGTAYSAPAPIVAGGTPPYTFLVAQNAVPGLTINSTTGAITGTPTTAGTFRPTIQVTDSGTPAKIAQTNFNVVVSPSGGQTLTIGPTALGALTNGTAATPITLTATSTTAPYTWSITSGALPAGLVLNNGTTTSTTSITSSTNSITVTGTPTTAGAYSFTLSITDSATPIASGSQAFSGTVSAATVAACAATPASRGSEALLTNMPFAFVLRGADDEDLPVAWAGSFTPDGAGGITAADLDFVGRTNGPSNFTVQLSGSSYSFGADGRGCLFLAIAGTTGAAKPVKLNKPNVIPVTPNVTFSFSLNTALNTGRITEFDLAQSSTIASGQMHQQTTTDFVLTNLATRFAFGFDGWATDVAAEDRVAIVGSFANAAGTLTSGTADDNVKGVVSGELSGGSGSLGAPSGSTGRGTGSYSLSATGPTFHFAYYVVNGSDLYVISNDDPTVQGNFILSGRALKANATSVALNGFYMVAVSGFNPAAGGGNVVTIGTINALTDGTVPTAKTYTNAGGTFQMQTFMTGSFTVDAASGRIALTAIGSTPVAYLTATAAEDDIAAFVVGAGGFTSSGFLALQDTSTPNFTLSDLTGPFAFGTAEDVAGLHGSSVGTYTFDGLGGYTGTVDSVTATGSVSSPNTPVSGTYTIAADGSGSGTLDTTKQFVTNGSLILAIDSTNATTQPLLYIFVK